MIISLLLIFGSNLAHSWEKGFRLPHIGPSQYFANADLGNQPLQFLSDFNHIQENLSVHSRSHPPGAVLFYALLGQMQFGETGLISLWILIFSALVSAWFLFEFLKREFPGENAGRFSFLFLLIPGVMIYFCASLDAVICAITISFFYFLGQEDNLKTRIGLMTTLFILNFLNFAMLFLFPVFLIWEIAIRKNSSRFFICASGIALLYILLFFLGGYNHVLAFFKASALENERGFELFSMPFVWVMSRIQAILEIVIFTGPLFCYAAWRGIPLLKKNHSKMNVLFLSGVIIFSAILFTGAYHCGETGRACLFLYPFLFLPVVAFFSREENEKLLQQAPFLLFGQSLFMQYIGNYFW